MVVIDRLSERDQEFVIHLINRNMRINSHEMGRHVQLVPNIWSILLANMFRRRIPRNLRRRTPVWLELNYHVPRTQHHDQ